MRAFNRFSCRSLFFLFCLCIHLSRAGQAQTLDESGHADEMLVEATDLQLHPERAARADQILVFHANSGVTTGRFTLARGQHRFCLSGGASYFTGITLLGDRRGTLSSSPSGEGCIQTTFPGGVLTIALQHKSTPPTNPALRATVQVDPLNAPATNVTPLVQPDGSPVGGF